VKNAGREIEVRHLNKPETSVEMQAASVTAFHICRDKDKQIKCKEQRSIEDIQRCPIRTIFIKEMKRFYFSFFWVWCRRVIKFGLTKKKGNYGVFNLKVDRY
jgi:hypothetical protein